MNFLRVRTGVEVEPLLERLRQTDLWSASQRETFEGSPHKEATSIILRWDDEDQPSAAQLMPEAGEAVMCVLEKLEAIGDLGRVMLTRIAPGKRLAEHVDEGLYADLFDRFHLCLQGDAGNRFHCGGETYTPKPGEVFWFNHKHEHWVENTGAVDRIHLIVDVMAPAYTRHRGRYYQRELIADLWEEAAPLLEAHWKEIARYPDIKLEPDVETYAQLEAAGQVRCYTARDAGHLVGYAVFLVKPNLHYKSSLQAYQDVLFMEPSQRAGMAGVKLIKHAERCLSAEGVQVVYHHAKRTNRVGELLERLGYELIDEIYAKRLDLKGG